MRADVVVTKVKQYNRHSTADIATVFDVMTQQVKQAELEKLAVDRLKIQVNGLLVKMGTLRLRTFFHKGIQCDVCGLSATHFALERDAFADPEMSHHLNLWGVKEGEEVLFTHDHLKSRACGGSDNLSNSRTCCSECNHHKSLMETKLKDLLKKDKHFVITKEWIHQNYEGVSETELNKVYQAFCQ